MSARPQYRGAAIAAVAMSWAALVAILAPATRRPPAEERAKVCAERLGHPTSPYGR